MTGSIDPKLESRLRTAAPALRDDGFSELTMCRLKSRRVHRSAALLGAWGAGLALSWPGLQSLLAQGEMARVLNWLSATVTATDTPSVANTVAAMTAICVCLIVVLTVRD